MTDGMRLEAVLKRDRVIVLSGLAGVSALAWLYLVYLSRGMPDAATAPARPAIDVPPAVNVGAITVPSR